MGLKYWQTLTSMEVCNAFINIFAIIEFIKSKKNQDAYNGDEKASQIMQYNRIALIFK